MAVSRPHKEKQLQALETKFQEAKGVAFANFNGLTVEEAQTIRRSLRKQGMTYTVIKKTLIQLAAKNAKLAEVDINQLEGAVAVIVSTEDEIAPLAAIKNFKKEFINSESKEAKINFAGAIFEGAFVDATHTAELANIPSREESLSKIVGMLRSGPQKLHGVFNSGFQNLYNVFQNSDKFAVQETA
jgi:large subunit ribosomal protein L10